MTTKRILFGEWLPDMPDNTGQETLNLDSALNVYSSTTGYAPFPKASIISEGTEDGEDINQLFLAKKDDLILAFGGTKENIYKYNNLVGRTATSNSVSKTGGYSNSAVAWDFASFGDSVLATNGADKIQRYVIGGAEDVPDEDRLKFNDIPQAPVCNTIAIVRDFVFAGYCDEDSQKIQWSDLNNETVWDSSDANQADFQILPSGGAVKAITGGEFGLILQEKAVTRASYIGTPLVFQFDQIADNTGCLTGKSAIQHSGMTYFLSESGFMSCDGSTVKNIGAGKVNNWFFDSLDSTQIETMDVAIDPLKNLIVWNFPSTGRIPTDEERLLIMYNYETGRWTSGSTNSQVVAQLATQGRPLDSMTPDSDYPELDTMPVSLDSPLFIGGGFAFCGAIKDRVCTFNLYNEATYLTTSDIEQGMFSVATLAIPIIENGSAEFQIASRNNLNQNIEWSASSVASAENRADLRGGGRYHRLRVKPTGAGWTHAIGFDLTVTPQGQR
jgi:hypothetical protein